MYTHTYKLFHSSSFSKYMLKTALQIQLWIFGIVGKIGLVLRVCNLDND